MYRPDRLDEFIRDINNIKKKEIKSKEKQLEDDKQTKL
jgi:hypothetical protein